MPTRLAIVNRGEAAIRLLNAVREINASGGPRYRTIAFHCTEERSAAFVRRADEAYDLGPSASRPYLDHAVLERALVATRAEQAWVGWGFVAEDAAFAELCGRLGVTFIGPSPQAMTRLGDKIGAKLLAEQCGVPVAPWSQGPVADLDEALQHAARIGYPLMLKAAAGGGGRGIRLVPGPQELARVFQPTRDEALRSFGSDVVFLESLVTGARHIEVQLLADGHGNAWALGVRDCSIQRRHQKLIEESSSPVLPAEQVQLVRESAIRLAQAVGYQGAGTVEFLYRPADGVLAFLEVNTRLQVEHPVTELVTGTDIVALQLHVAAGGQLTGPAPTESGHAVEVRLNVEDADRDFAPAPGRIALLRLPAGPGVRVDAGFTEGDVVPAAYDSMIAKIIAHGSTREAALTRLERALTDTQVVIEGGTTNKAFLLDLLRSAPVRTGSADTGWIDSERQAGGLRSGRLGGVAVVAAGIEAYRVALASERQHFLRTARGGRPQAQAEIGRVFQLKLRGRGHRIRVAQISPHGYRIGLDGAEIDVELEWLDGYAGRLRIAGVDHRVLVSTHPGEHQVEVEDTVHRVQQDEGGVVRAPSPALVVSTPVAAGEQVSAGQTLLVLESMKMETLIPAPSSGRVSEILVRTGDQVTPGQALAQIEAQAEDEVAASVEVESVLAELFPSGEPDATFGRAGVQEFADLRHLLLGFDLHPPTSSRAVSDASETPADATVFEAELEAVRVFADFGGLFHDRVRPADGPAGRVLSCRESFHRYIRSLDPDRDGLSEDFLARLGQVLAHYGIHALTHTPELEAAIFRIYLSQQRRPTHQAALIGLLRRWLAAPPPDGALREEADLVLADLLSATPPSAKGLTDLLRMIRFRWFDRPAGGPESRDSAIRALARALTESAPTTGSVLTALAERKYRHSDLVMTGTADRPVVWGDYQVDARPSHLVSAAGRHAELAELLQLVAAHADQAAGRELTVDLYLLTDDGPAAQQVTPPLLAQALDGFAAGHRPARITVVLIGERDLRITRHTFRPIGLDSPTLGEDTRLRGAHPMQARQFNLERLCEFELTRLEASDDVLLYRAQAASQPIDVRLIALAGIDRLSVIRDEQGRVNGLPELEAALASSVDAVRQARAAEPKAHLDLNQVWLHINPVIDTPLPDLLEMRHRLAALTADADLAEVVVECRAATEDDGQPHSLTIRFSQRPGVGVTAEVSLGPAGPLRPLDAYTQNVLRARRRGATYPYELVSLLARGGTFVEYDLDRFGELVPVDRPAGGNTAGIVVGLVNTPTTRCPEGLTRVVLLGDPTKSLGSLSEAECSRVVAALDLASRFSVPVEWFAVSSGARISMDSGTENMDWVARALRRIVTFTQAGGEINIVVAGINVGAQPYWNAEATMLMHTKGILVMTPESAMVLTGKRSLDYSGGVSAEDNFGIGGYHRVMGPNGQAQYWAPDLAGAVEVLFRHYDHSYLLPGERYPRPAPSCDPRDRDVCASPHVLAGSDFRTVGDIFSATANPERKKPFDIRAVMRAVADADHEPLERWAGMADAETAVVLDAHLGGYPVCLIGIESRPVDRRGFPPSDGPEAWTAGTLFPRSSAKTARAINSASGVRPVVVLANLSGFDGSPESMRNLQLEYGAEIGRAVVNFQGPIVFCVVSRYHGGAFVVFSKTLNPRMTVLAVEGAYASVIGGAPAAGVVFAGEVDSRTVADPRVRTLEQELEQAVGTERARLQASLASVRAAVRAEKLGQVATEFDAIHSIERAVRVGSVDALVPAAELRPRIIAAVETGMALDDTVLADSLLVGGSATA